MPLIKKGQNVLTFTPSNPIERHFHNHDEAWIVLEGRATAKLTTKEGSTEFVLEPGDVWMIEIGEEHEAVPIDEVFKIMYIHGTTTEGVRAGEHLYKEKEKGKYEPSFRLVKAPIS